MQDVENAVVGGPTVLRGRPSATRAEWESARMADAMDLNSFIEAGGEIEAYVAPLWSNEDAERCLGELHGFDEARVYAELAPGAGAEAALAAIAESDWAGACGGDAAVLVHAAASLDVPILLPGLDPALALKALALAIGEDLSPREIETALRGEWRGEPQGEALEHAGELLGAGR